MSYHCIVKQGDLLDEERATFIVNASNTQLQLGSGVSMAFAHHCGDEFQREMDAELQKLGSSLQKGDVVATSPGKADNFKYALHAAVMDYNAGVNGRDIFPSLQDIENALKNIEAYLQRYAQEKQSEGIKLVLPLMGCGVGGLSKPDVIGLYKKFFSREVMFECEVVIYGHSREDFELIKTIF